MRSVDGQRDMEEKKNGKRRVVAYLKVESGAVSGADDASFAELGIEDLALEGEAEVRALIGDSVNLTIELLDEDLLRI